MSQSEDMTAIDAYFKRVAAVTPEADKVKKAWMLWYPSLGFYDKNFNGKVYDEARTRKNAFNLSNAKTPAEKAQVVHVMTTGMTTETMQGKPRVPVNPQTGAVGSQVARQQTAAINASGFPTIKQGSKGAKGTSIGDAVIKWQQVLGVTADGNFGSGTHAKTVTWQKAHALTADGVVGSKTWAAALGAAPAATAPPENPGLISQAVSFIKPPVVAKPAVQAPAVTATIANKPKPGIKPPVTPTPVTPPLMATASMLPGKGLLDWFKKLPVWVYVAGAGAAVIATAGGAASIAGDREPSRSPRSIRSKKRR